MKINFTKEQYENLMKLVYLGNWVANANRTDDTIEKYEKLEDYIFSFAKDFGLEKYVDDEEADNGKFFPTRFFEEETDVDELCDEYDDETFWSELPDRLGERDFFRKYSQEELEKMSREERFLKMQECIIRWEEELDNNGIERFGINEK
jgi:hypothetical protein